jgi:hypothetical protein
VIFFLNELVSDNNLISVKTEYFAKNLIQAGAEKFPQPNHTCLCRHNFREKGDTAGEPAMPPLEVSV